MSDPAFRYSIYPVTVTLPFRDWGRISGYLRILAEEKELPVDVVVDVARWLEVITKAVWQATDQYLSEDT